MNCSRRKQTKMWPFLFLEKSRVAVVETTNDTKLGVDS